MGLEREEQRWVRTGRLVVPMLPGFGLLVSVAASHVAPAAPASWLLFITFEVSNPSWQLVGSTMPREGV